MIIRILIGMLLVMLGLQLGFDALGIDIPLLDQVSKISIFLVPFIIIYFGIRLIIGPQKENHTNHDK